MNLQIGLLVYAQEEKILKASDSLTKESSFILIFIFKFIIMMINFGDSY